MQISKHVLLIKYICPNDDEIVFHASKDGTFELRVIPSPMTRFTLGSANPMARLGKNFFDTYTKDKRES
jgi:hypothetical protein